MHLLQWGRTIGQITPTPPLDFLGRSRQGLALLVNRADVTNNVPTPGPPKAQLVGQEQESKHHAWIGLLWA